MTAADFQRIALSLEGVEEDSHGGLPTFRVGGRRFASLASQAEGYGNLTLTLEQQAAFVEEAPEIFLPIPGGWGKMGHTQTLGQLWFSLSVHVSTKRARCRLVFERRQGAIRR